jgi:rubredoxin
VIPVLVIRVDGERLPICPECGRAQGVLFGRAPVHETAPGTAFQRIHRARRQPNAKADLPPPENTSTNKTADTAVQSSALLDGGGV